MQAGSPHVAVNRRPLTPAHNHRLSFHPLRPGPGLFWPLSSPRRRHSCRVSSRRPASRQGPASPALQCASYLNAPGLSPPLPPKERNLVGRLSRGLVHAFPFLASKELLRRVAATIVLLALSRVGHFLPLPGLDLAYVAGAEGAAQQLTGMHEVPGNIFLLGITPFVSAYFALAITSTIPLPGLGPYLASLREQGRPGRETLQGYIATIFTVIALGEATGRARALASAAAAQPAGWAFGISTVVSLMAGATIVKFIIQCLDSWGLGEGTGTLIGLGIAVNYAQYVSGLLASPPAVLLAPGGALRLLCCAALCAALVAAFLWAQGVELRLPLVFFGSRRSQVVRDHPVLQQLGAQQGRRGGGGGGGWGSGPDALSGPGAETGVGGLEPQQGYFPLRLAPHGARQLLFANFLVGALLDPLLRFLTGGWLNPLLHTPWALALVVYAQEALSLSDTTPKQLAEYLSNCQMGIRGLSPGEDTQRFLAQRRRQLRHLSGALMACASLAAHGVDRACEALAGTPLGALSLLLLASTVAGMARQVSAQLKGPQLERLIAQERELLGAAAQ